MWKDKINRAGVNKKNELPLKDLQQKFIKDIEDIALNQALSDKAIDNISNLINEITEEINNYDSAINYGAKKHKEEFKQLKQDIIHDCKVHKRPLGIDENGFFYDTYNDNLTLDSLIKDLKHHYPDTNDKRANKLKLKLDKLENIELVGNKVDKTNILLEKLFKEVKDNLDDKDQAKNINKEIYKQIQEYVAKVVPDAEETFRYHTKKSTKKYMGHINKTQLDNINFAAPKLNIFEKTMDVVESLAANIGGFILEVFMKIDDVLVEKPIVNTTEKATKAAEKVTKAAGKTTEKATKAAGKVTKETGKKVNKIITRDSNETQSELKAQVSELGRVLAEKGHINTGPNSERPRSNSVPLAHKGKTTSQVFEKK